MEILGVLLAAFLLTARPDPTPGLIVSPEQARRYDCERVTPESTQLTHPGQVLPTPSRGDMVERSAIVCRERLVRPGLRDPRDEAVLSDLEARVTELAGTARALRPDLSDRTWLVEVAWPSAQVSAKIDFAAKNALLATGASVSDRGVTLAVGDVGVLSRMAPTDAWPAACTRYAGTGSLREGDALLALVSVDPRDTALHAGLCDRGVWSWLR